MDRKKALSKSRGGPGRPRSAFEPRISMVGWVRFPALSVFFGAIACGETMPECPTVYEDPGPGAALGLVTDDADILPQAQCAAARWTNATGIKVRAGEPTEGSNITFRWWSGPGPNEDRDLIGEYLPDERVILVKNTLPGKFVFPALVAHEVGHALEDSGEHIAADAAGLMTPNEMEDPAITAADLALICERADCVLKRAE